jgi:hypothetical protein
MMAVEKLVSPVVPSSCSRRQGYGFAACPIPLFMMPPFHTGFQDIRRHTNTHGQAVEGSPKFFIAYLCLFFARLNLCASLAQASSLPALQDTMVNFVEEKADTDVELVSERHPVCGLGYSLASC